MKKRILCALLAALLVLTCVGCGGKTEETKTPDAPKQEETKASEATEPTGEEKIADTLVIAYANGPYILDPVMIPGHNATIWLTDLLFGALVRPNDDGTEIMPWLADSWEVSEDGLTYTFKLKQGVKFSDGSEVTADDWVFSLLRARDTEESNWHASTDAIADVVKVDEETIAITLVAPRESFLAEIGMFNNSVQSKAHVEAVGDEANQTNPMGTGPYMIKEWVIDEYILFEKNPHYFDADNVKTQYIRFNIVPDSSARMLQLESGEAHIINEVPFNSIATLDAMDGIKAMGVQSTETQMVNFNMKHPIVGNLKVRQALRYATDMQMIVDLVVAGMGTRATSYMTSSGLYYNDDLPLPEYDLEKAKALLAEAGYPNGFDITMMCRADRPAYEEIAVILKEQWAQVGVNIEIQVLEHSAYIEKRNNVDYELTFLTWTDDIPHPSQIGAHFYDYSKERGFFCDYNNPEGYEILQKALTELDPVKCEEYYHELQKIWYDDIPSMCLYYGNIPVAMSENVQGYVQTSLGKYRLEHCYVVE